MNCARIYSRPNSTCKASAKHLAAAKTSALATCKSEYSVSNRSDHFEVTTVKAGKTRSCSENIYLILTLQAKQQD